MEQHFFQLRNSRNTRKSNKKPIPLPWQVFEFLLDGIRPGLTLSDTSDVSDIMRYFLGALDFSPNFTILPCKR